MLIYHLSALYTHYASTPLAFHRLTWYQRACRTCIISNVVLSHITLILDQVIRVKPYPFLLYFVMTPNIINYASNGFAACLDDEILIFNLELDNRSVYFHLTIFLVGCL